MTSTHKYVDVVVVVVVVVVETCTRKEQSPEPVRSPSIL